MEMDAQNMRSKSPPLCNAGAGCVRAGGEPRAAGGAAAPLWRQDPPRRISGHRDRKLLVPARILPNEHLNKVRSAPASACVNAPLAMQGVCCH